MLLIRVVLCIFAHTSLIAAQTAGGNFIQPPASPAGGQSAGDYSQDPVYVVGASLNIQWQTDIPNQAVSVGLWQQGVSADQQGTTIVPNTTLDSAPWDGIPAQDLSLGRVFFMQIYDSSDLSLLATTHYFNMTGDKPSYASSSSPSAAALSTSTSVRLTTTATMTTSSVSSTMTTTTAASSTPAATSAAAESSSSNHTLVVGVGAGVGVAVFLAATGTAIGVFFCLRHRKLKKRQSAALPTTDTSPYPYTYNHELDSKGTATTISHPNWQGSTRQELPATRQELQ